MSLDHHIAGLEAVAIGASAGGVEALLAMLAELPQTFPVAVLIVLHLPPDQPSRLPQLLSYRCALPVREAQDKETIMPGTVYIAPPDYHLLVEPDKSLALSNDEPVNFSRPSIDLLFESAALAYRSGLLGIILTGASADGSAGLKAIKQMGGTAWVQDPDDAVAFVMPQAAIEAARPDLVLPLQQLIPKLAGLTNNTSNDTSSK